MILNYLSKAVIGPDTFVASYMLLAFEFLGLSLHVFEANAALSIVSQGT
jgi:hypothetical protein